MVTEHRINADRVYYNYQGRMPPVPLESEPAQIPVGDTEPRLITDTTLRDGAQDARFPLFPNEARLRYVDLLHQLDNGTGRIYAIETFIYQKRDLWVLDKLLERGYEWPKITTWIRATPRDVKEMYEASQGRVKETGMLASSSDHHIFDKLGYRSKEEAIDKYLKPIMTALEYDITPRVHLEDTTRADIHGWVIPFMQTVLKQTEGRAKFRVCDTIGWGVPDPHAGLPMGIPKLISTLYRETGAELEFHGHNDYGVATANSLAAWRYGCRKVNAAFASLGERTGNTSLEQMVATMIRFYGDPGFNLKVLPEMAELVSTNLTEVPRSAPIIGDVFTTSAGIHQAGVARQEEAPGGLIYLAYDPAIVGREGAERSVVGALSGAEGIVSVLNAKAEELGIETRFSSTSRIVKEIYDRIQAAYNGEYDASRDAWTGYKTAFFTADEIWQMAAESMDLDGSSSQD
jgi:isopropylmalate/homocitrate/citramalate synthase